MQTNREIKIAIVVGAIMLTACLLVFIFIKSERTSNGNVNQVDIKVYKVNEEKKTYEPCHITTDTLIQINSEFKRASRLTDSKRVIGKSINGTYRIDSGDNFIAFDAKKDENYIYRNDTKYLYEFDTELYNIVVKACQ